jgi:hypothetical protein
MTDHRPLATWLRPLVGSFALVGILLLSACGGGSGAPNNPYAPVPVPPGPLTLLPTAATIYSGVPATLAVTGGFPPYRAFSSNTAVLPVTQSVAGGTLLLLASNVSSTADTSVTITVQDSASTVASASITVRFAPLINGLTITPNAALCGTNAVCSGQTATASVSVLGPEGGAIPNRQVRFDRVQGAFLIETNNQAQPLASTLTVVSDANGVAQVIILATANAFTQPALIRATDVTSGNQVTGQFTIVQTIDGAAVLSVIPATATITSASATACSTGFPIDYFIYGGTPPYRVTTTFPSAVTLVNSTVTTSGGFFEAITNGTCVDPLTFSIFDSVGLQTTATLQNLLGAGTPPPPAALAVAPAAYGAAATPVANCTLASGFDFVISGGTPPFSATTTGGTATPNPVLATPGNVKITYPVGVTPGAHPVVIADSSSPQKTATATVFCP